MLSPTMHQQTNDSRRSSADSSSSFSSLGPLLDPTSRSPSLNSRRNSPTLPPLDPNELPSILRRSPHLLSPPVTPPRPVTSLYSDSLCEHNHLQSAEDELGIDLGCTHPLHHPQVGEYFGLLKLSNRVQPSEGTDLPTTPPSRVSSSRNSPHLPHSSTSEASHNTVHLDFDQELDGDLSVPPTSSEVNSSMIDAFLAEHDRQPQLIRSDSDSSTSLSSSSSAPLSPLTAVRGLGLPHGMWPSPRGRVEEVKRGLLGLSPSGSGFIAPLPTPVAITDAEEQEDQYPWLQASMQNAAVTTTSSGRSSIGCWPFNWLLRRRHRRGDRQHATMGVVAAWMPMKESSSSNALALAVVQPPPKVPHKLSPWFISESVQAVF